MNLPPVQRAKLDEDSLADLLTDLETSAELLDVRVKHGPTIRASDSPTPFADAVRLLGSEASIAIQLRYRHGGTLWCDTLTKTADGVEIVRIELAAVTPG